LASSLDPMAASSGHHHHELDIDDLMQQLHVQVSHYEREKIACRLKICFSVQLVRQPLIEAAPTMSAMAPV